MSAKELQKKKRLGKSRLLTTTDSKNVDRDKVRRLCVSVLQERLRRSTNHEHVRDTEDEDTPANELEATSARISKITEDERKSVDQHVEGLVDGIGLDGTHAERTSGLLGSPRGSSPTIATLGQRAVDEVVDETHDTVVGGTLAELDGANHVCDGGESTGDTAQSSLLLICWLVLVVIVNGELLFRDVADGMTVNSNGLLVGDVNGLVDFPGCCLPGS